MFCDTFFRCKKVKERQVVFGSSGVPPEAVGDDCRALFSSTDIMRISKSLRKGLGFSEVLEMSSFLGRAVDALALEGDEGRGKLRKASGSRKQALIRRCPNGETPRGNPSRLFAEFIGK